MPVYPALAGWAQCGSGLRVGRARIRTQRERWGSYSVKGAPSLNAALLFLIPPTVRYVLIHELCPTVHHRQPPAFRKLVRRLEPDYRRLNAATEKAEGKVPAWVKLQQCSAPGSQPLVVHCCCGPEVDGTGCVRSDRSPSCFLRLFALILEAFL